MIEVHVLHRNKEMFRRNLLAYKHKRVALDLSWPRDYSQLYGLLFKLTMNACSITYQQYINGLPIVFISILLLAFVSPYLCHI